MNEGEFILYGINYIERKTKIRYNTELEVINDVSRNEQDISRK